MAKALKSKLLLLFLILVYVAGFCLFYYKYVPLIKSFQMALVPFLFIIIALTALNVEWGILFFAFSFPLINNLPYFFGIYGHIPHAPTALVLFLAFFGGWLINNLFSGSEFDFSHPVFKPLLLLSLILLVSGIITFFRYANFFPFVSSNIYELTVNVNGVKAGGSLMSNLFSFLNYFT